MFSPDPSPSNVTSTSVTEPPDYVKAVAPQFLSRSTQLSNIPFSEYGGERISPLTPFHAGGMDLAASRAFYGDPAVEAGRGMLTDTLSGKYTENPLLNASWNRAADQLQARMGSQVLPMQGLTNTGYAQAMQQGLNDLSATVYGQERQNQMNAAPLALQYGQEPYDAANALMGVGDVGREYDQARINEAIRAFEAQRMWPYQQADVLGRAIGMSMGGGFGSTTSSQPGYFQPSRTAGMLGGGLAGYGLAQGAGSQSFFGQNPLAGAGLGALGGYFL